MLGVGQCVNWGVLYYAFAVLLLPVERDLSVARWVVAGAFSVALFMSAALAPAIGRWSDRGHGAFVMQVGGFSAAGFLLSWALIPSVATLYVVWAGLGVCMAATLYEPAFAIVGRAYDHPTDRLRALAAVTLFGGLASTVWLPMTALLVGVIGWRAAVVVLACAVAASTFLTHILVFRRLNPAAPTSSSALSQPSRAEGDRSVPRFWFLLVVFSLCSAASAAFTTNLIPALGERDVSPTTAAMLGGLLGVMQLPGRALLMKGGLTSSPAGLVLISLALQAAGLVCVAIGPSLLVIAGGIALLGVGAGLTTLVRPHVVQTLFAMESAGQVNGRLARSQQVARATGPILATWFASVAGYGLLVALLGTAFAALAIASRPLLNGLDEAH